MYVSPSGNAAAEACADSADEETALLYEMLSGMVEGKRFSYVGEDVNLNDDERRALQDAKERLAKGEDPKKIWKE